jgi:hypothetical protein
MEGDRAELRERALELLEENLARVETTPRRPIDPGLVHTEADQVVVNVSVAFETLSALGLLSEGDRERFFSAARHHERELRALSGGRAPAGGGRAARAGDPGPPPARGGAVRGRVVLRWLFVSPPSGQGERQAEYRPPQVFTLWDDAGAAYTPQGGGWVPGHHLRGDTAFVPAVPPEATRLQVAADRHRFELALDRAPRDDAPEPPDRG